jgi:tRNA (guanine37-N1)-methyltransferase
MLIQILTLFPQMFTGVLESSILKRAQEQNLVKFELINFRDFATDKHHMVDDTPYGGGSGMVLKPEPIFRALQYAHQQNRQQTERGKAKVILLTPQGKVFKQEIARELATAEGLIMICGHYEGFDERICSWVDLELSIGDYVLTGGEPAAMVVSDAVVRLIPGVLGSSESAQHDSFSEYLLDFPQYTRPVEFEGMRVPDILLSGHHAMIEAWRREQALIRTAKRRPDLLENAPMSEEDLKILKAIGELNNG